MADYASTIEIEGESSTARYRDLIENGWEDTQARIFVHMQDMALATGKTLEDAEKDWLAYQQAVEDGDEERQKMYLDRLKEWDEATAESRDAAHEATKETQAAQLEELKAFQASELDSLKKTQATELALHEDQRKEKLDQIKASQDAAMDLMKTAQAAELAELKAGQEREMDSLRSARQEALSVMERAIQRELEEERIKVRLRLDLLAAGSDKEAQDAAHARATESEARLADNRAMSAAMEAAEARIRERHQAELDEINAKWDEKEALTTARHETEATKLEAHHAVMLDGEQQVWDDMKDEWTYHFDVVKLPFLKEKHAEELTELQAHQAAQLTEFETSGAAQVAVVTSTVGSINAATAALRDRTVTITTVHRTVGTPRRADGGPVGAGLTYLVGERGPEYFVPDRDGTIVPNSGTGGGGGGGGVTPGAIRRALDGMQLRLEGVDRVILEELPGLAERVL